MASKQKPLTPKDKKYVDICEPPGPGPNAYLLPPVVGYPRHDTTRWRYPAYSMGSRNLLKQKDFGPGPKYDVKSFTRFGKDPTIAAKVTGRPMANEKTIGPGPGAYAPENHPDPGKPSAPAARLTGRTKPVDTHFGPGPGSYKPMGGVGEKNPNYPSVPSATVNGRHVPIRQSAGPGPGAYNPKYIGREPPVATITGRPYSPKKQGGPGPAYYPKHMGPRAPSHAFGVKPSKCVGNIVDKDADNW